MSAMALSFKNPAMATLPLTPQSPIMGPPAREQCF